jgi:NurA-like 5'-3' nuclease
MSKKVIIIVSSIVGLILIGAAAYLYLSLQKQKKEKADLEQLAAMDKREMENEYSQFALQYDELKRSIRNDSLMQRLTEEENKTKSLLAELRQTKSNDAAEISRLKRELATVRAVLRSYIIQVDSLNRLNENLTRENQQVKARYNEATNQISSLTSEKQNLSDQVAIASQLDATGVSLIPQNKRGKTAKKTKDIKQFVVNFTITKNITAKTGNRHIYVRVTQPNNSVVGQSGTTKFESSSIGYSAVKVIEYTGQETRQTVYIPVSEFLSAGTYHVYIITDGNLIGSGSLTLNK